MPRSRRPAPPVLTDDGPRSDDGAPIERAMIAPAPVRVQVFGAARILVGDQVLGPGNIVLFSVLLRLVYSPAMAAPRDVLCRELWPQQELLRQRGNLRQAMYKLRLIGVQISTEGDLIRLDRTQVVRTFAVEPTPELFDRDITRGQEPFGPFLPGFVAITEEFQEWIESTRERVHSDVRRVLVDFLRSRRERADWSGAEALARWVLELDPLNEDATLTTAECAMLRGSKTEAVAILDRYLLELGPRAGDIRLPAAVLRKRFVEPSARRRAVALVTTEHFLGRERDVAELTLALRRARWHDGSAVLLHGPPGIGKSRVLIELSKVAQVEGYHEITLECRESIQSRPLGALLEVMPELLSKPGALGCSPESLALIRKLLGMVPSQDTQDTQDTQEAVDTADRAADGVQGAPSAGHTGDATQPLAAVLDTPTPISPGTPADGAPAGEPPSAMERFELALRTIRAQSIRHAVVDLFASLTEEKPIFVIVEDAHWIDDATWEVLSDVIQRVGEMRVFMVLASHYGTVREERPARMSARLEVRRLPALGPELMERLAHAIAKEQNAELPPAVVSWLLRCSEGTPLLLRALLEHWVQTGQSEGVPPTLTMLIDTRLDRLDATSLRALQAIALLARFASLDRIKVVLELPIHELIRALDQLEGTGCLASSQASLVITHDLVRQMAERRMSPLVETALRATIGDALEAEYLVTRDVPTLLEAMLHIELSRRPDVLYRFVIRHEEALLDSGRPAAVLRATKALREASPAYRVDRRIDRLTVRAELDAGEYKRALESYTGTISLSKNPGELSDLEVDELLSYVDSAYRADWLTDRLELAQFAATVALSDGVSLRTRVRAAEIGMTIASNLCAPSVARSCIRVIRNESEQIPEERSRTISLMYELVFGSIAQAESLADEILKRIEARLPSTKVIQDLGRTGFVHRVCGNVSRALECFNRQYDMAVDLEVPRLAQYAAWQGALISLETGDKTGFAFWNERVLLQYATDEDPISSNFIKGYLCQAAIEFGDHGAAFNFLRETQEGMPRMPTPKALGYLVALELGARLLDDVWTPSQELLERALDLHEKTGAFCTSDFLTANIATAIHRLGRAHEARDFVRYYMTKQRRERGSASAHLLRCLNAIDYS